MANADKTESEQEAAPSLQRAGLPQVLEEESQITEIVRTNTAGSSKATAAPKDRTATSESTLSSKGKGQLTWARHAIKRLTPTNLGDTPPKKEESSEPARQINSENATLKLLSPGASDILADIIAIRDYHDDSSTAWTFNLELLRKKLQESPESSTQPVAESRKRLGQPLDRQAPRTREREHASSSKGKSAIMDGSPDSLESHHHITVQVNLSGRQPPDPRVNEGTNQLYPDSATLSPVQRAPARNVVEVSTGRNRDHSHSNKLPPKHPPPVRPASMTRRRSRTEAHETPGQDEKLSSASPLSEEGTNLPRFHDDLSVNWLIQSEMLPQQAPWARIFGFEYPRQHKDRSSKPTQLQSLVSCLSTQLREVRYGVDEKRPLVFITHNFGFAIFLELLFSEASGSNAADQVHLRKSLAAVFVFLTSAEGSTDDMSMAKYVGNQSMYKQVLPDSLPYAETRNQDYVDSHMVQVSKLISLVSGKKSTGKAPSPLVQLMNDDGKQFKDSADMRFLAFAKSLTKATQARLILQATVDGKRDVLKHYEECGWDLNLTDKTGRCALHYAIATNRMDVLYFLLTCKGIKVDAKDAGGQTALHYAVNTLMRPQEAIAMLVDNGADATIMDKNGITVLDMARTKNIRQFPKTFRAITGPTSDPSMVLQLANPANLDEMQQLAAENCLMAMAEFFSVKENGVETEKFVMQRPSIFQVLYRMSPDDILDEARRKTEMKLETRVCRWLHIPANHAGWVDGLFGRLGMAKESIQIDQHSGNTYWSNYLRPHCRKFKVVRRPLPSASKRPQPDQQPGPLGAPDVRGDPGTLLYIPFVTSERHCDQRALYDTLVGDKRSFIRDIHYIAGRQPLASKALTTASESDFGDNEEAEVVLEPIVSRGSGDEALADETNIAPSEKAVTSDTDLWKYSTASSKGNGAESARLLSERELLYAFSDSFTGFGRPLHIRRTLDQSHYLMLGNTTDRDRDQVVLRRQRERIGSQHGSVSDSSRAHDEDLEDQNRMVMVDQLWLWVVDDTVISSFPRSWPQPDWENECDVLDRLIGYINATQQRGPIKSSQDLAKLIVKHCVEVFNHPQHEGHYHPLSLHDAFETSVGQVADQEMTLFRQFEEQVFKLKKWEIPENEKEGRDSDSETISDMYYHYTVDEGSDGETVNEMKHAPNKNGKETQESENEILDKLFDIQREIKILDEAKDVHDELRMILRIFGEQKRVVEDWCEILMPSANPDSRRAMERIRDRHLSRGAMGSDKMMESADGETVPAQNPSLGDVAEDAYATIQSNLKDFTRMLEHVTAAEQGINQLLNLKQKEANALEARFSRKSSEAATKQGNTILFFTIVTIIFGSLSFITTFFALNVTAFPLDTSSGEPVWGLRQVIGLIIGLSLGLSIPFVVMAFAVNPMMDLGTRVTRKIVSQIEKAILMVSLIFGVFGAFGALSGLSRRRRRRTSESSYYSSYFGGSSGPTMRPSSRSSPHTDTDLSWEEKTGWLAKAGNSLRRLKPRLRSRKMPSDVVNSSGSDQRFAYV